MFKVSKRRIVMLILFFLALFLSLSVAVIYGVSYYSVYQQNQSILNDCANRYMDTMINIDSTKSDAAKDDQFMQMLEYQGIELTLFYAVALDKDGRITNVMNIPDPQYSEDELIDIATQMLASGKNKGIYKGWVYQCRSVYDYDIAVWMDNTVLSRDLMTLLKNSLFIGAIFIALTVPFAIKAANHIISPIEETEKKQQIFLANAEHELKTPITSIGANAELLSREIGKNQWLDAICQENSRMAKMVMELLELSRVESVVGHKEEIDFSKLVWGGILPYETIAFDMGCPLKTDIDSNVLLYGDGNQLSRLIAILMDNAVSHSSGTAPISVVLKPDGKHVYLTVSNTGKTISPEVQSHLFERFYRGENTPAKEGHFGLGLSIAKAIVEAHDGNISVESKDGLTKFIATF